MKITNKQHIYYNEPVRVMNYLDEEKVELFVINPDIEAIIIANLNDIAEEKEAILPRSRKDFYEYIQKTTTSRVHIEATVKQLVDQNIIELKNMTIDGLIKLVRNNDLDKTQLIEEFRTLRDQGYFDFNLANNSYALMKKKYKKY